MQDARQERLEGREKVRHLFVERIDQAGMVRQRGQTVEEHSAMQKRLIERLAYMSDENLVTLAELVIEGAQGAQRNVWPAEVTVIGWANNLERCPPTEHRVVTSWLASIEGPRALAGGFEVELYEYLARYRQPPRGGVDNRMIRERAEENARQVELIRDRIARDVASPEDRAWLEHYMSLRTRVRSIIASGQKKRAAA